MLGDLSDRWGRRPVLIFSLLGTVVSFVMLAVATAWRCSLPRASSTACRAATSRPRAPTSRTSPPKRTARRRSVCSAPPLASASSSGPALGAAFSRISYTAPIWAAAAITRRGDGAGIFLVAGDRPPRACRGPVAVAGARRVVAAARSLRVLFTIDFVYWTAFAVYQTTFALFGARRFGFDAAHTGYLLSAFGFLGVVVQGGMVGPVVQALGERRTLAIGLAVGGDRLGWQRAHALAAGVRRDARARARSASACAMRRSAR